LQEPDSGILFYHWIRTAIAALISDVKQKIISSGTSKSFNSVQIFTTHLGLLYFRGGMVVAKPYVNTIIPFAS
jgi:hypothetical protein